MEEALKFLDDKAFPVKAPTAEETAGSVTGAQLAAIERAARADEMAAFGGNADQALSAMDRVAKAQLELFRKQMAFDPFQEETEMPAYDSKDFMPHFKRSYQSKERQMDDLTQSLEHLSMLVAGAASANRASLTRDPAHVDAKGNKGRANMSSSLKMAAGGMLRKADGGGGAGLGIGVGGTSLSRTGKKRGPLLDEARLTESLPKKHAAVPAGLIALQQDLHEENARKETDVDGALGPAFGQEEGGSDDSSGGDESSDEDANDDDDNDRNDAEGDDEDDDDSPDVADLV